MPSSSPAAHSSPTADRGRAAFLADTFCFSIQAAAEPGVMPRVLELFAKRNLVPSKWHSIAGAEGELQIDIQVEGLAADLGDYIAACLRQIVHVDTVLTSLKHARPEAVPDVRRRRA